MQSRQTIGHIGRRSSIEKLTRVGFICKGVVYILVGVLALMAAFSEGGETTDQKGAIQRIAAQPFGEFALLVIGIGLLAYAFWRFVCAFSDTEHEGNDGKGIAKRVGYFASGSVYTTIAIFALRTFAGDPTGGGGGGAQSWTGKLLAAPGGQILVAAAGLAILIAGVFQIREGLQEKFRRKLRLNEMNAQESLWATRTGKWGYVARGIVFGIMGIFTAVAALRSDASEARGLEGALDTLAAQPFGAFLLAFVAAGLMSYGAYCIIEARYRKVQA